MDFLKNVSSTNIFLFLSNMLLLIADIIFDFKQIHIGFWTISVVLLVVSFNFTRYFSKFAMYVGILYLAYFLYSNYNFVFIMFLCLMVALLILNFIRPKLNISHSVYLLIPLLILAQIVWLNFLPLGYEASWTLNVGYDGDSSQRSEMFLIDVDNVLSSRKKQGNESRYRVFNKDGSFQVGFNTPIDVHNKDLDLRLVFNSSSPIYINDEIVYNPKWDDFKKIKSFSNFTVYAYKDFEFKEQRLEEFLRNNFKNGILVKDFTGQFEDIEKEMNSKFIENINNVENYENFNSQVKRINASFRGPVSFYGVFDKSLEFSFEKQEQNWYEGSDDIRIIISDINSDVIYNKSFDDVDGNFNDNSVSSKWIYNHVKVEIEKPGIYKIEILENPQYDKQDFLIEKVEFNSNKIMTAEKFLLWSPSKLYYEDGGDVLVKYWHSGYFQKLIFENGWFYELSKEDKGQWREFDISEHNSFEVEKGNMWVDSKTNFAFWENGWFEKEVQTKIIISKSENLQNTSIINTNFEKLIISSQKESIIKQVRVDIKNE